MSLDQIKTTIKTVLEGVSGIGIVHDYGRFTSNWKDFLGMFSDSANRINGWVITRTSTKEKIHSPSSVNLRSHEIEIKGFYGLKDQSQSEKVFQNLIESVCTELRQNNDLSGNCLKSSPPQVVKVDQRTFGNMLVHACDIKLTVDEYISYS